MNISKTKLKAICKEMLRELEDNGLEVVLVPAPDPRHECHMIRAVQYANAPWYQKFCALYGDRPSDPRRRIRTRIKRQGTIRALRNMAQGRFDSIYAERLIDFIERDLEDQKRSAEVYVPKGDGIPF